MAIPNKETLKDDLIRLMTYKADILAVIEEMRALQEKADILIEKYRILGHSCQDRMDGDAYYGFTGQDGQDYVATSTHRSFEVAFLSRSTYLLHIDIQAAEVL